MKRYQNGILVLSVTFFTMCTKKDKKLESPEIGNSIENSRKTLSTNIKEWFFDTNGNAEGWTSANLTSSVSSGTLNLTSTTTDPLIKSPNNLNITTPATYKYVHIEMKNNSPVTAGQIFFITNTDVTWNEAKSKVFTLKPNTSYYGDYIVDMSTVPGWTGTIKQIRIDPLNPGAVGQTVNIDFIRVTDNKPLRGVMSPGGATSSADMATLKNTWKANLIRWQINSPNSALPTTLAAYDAWLDAEIVQLDGAMTYCEQNDIKVIIDLHFLPGGRRDDSSPVIFYDQAANDKIVAVWQKLATRYKDRVALYGYDLMNEPVQTSTPPAGLDFKSTQVRIGNAIRAIDRKTPIFIEVDNWDKPANYTNFTPVGLTNVIYQAHMYEPHAYTHQQVSNPGDPLYTYPGIINGVFYDKAKLTSLLQPVLNFQNNYNARIYIGEFSAIRWAGGAATWLKDCIDIFESYGWSWSYHAYREATVWSLEYKNQKTPEEIATTPTDRYNVVVGYGLSKNEQ